MIYKSYQVEQNFNKINLNCFLFYGENLGLKIFFKNKIRKDNENCEFLIFDQEDIIKNNNVFFNEITNISLFQKEKIFFVNNVNDKFFEIFKKIEEFKTEQKIILFSDLLEKKSKLRNFFEKSSNSAIIPCYADNEISIRKIILHSLKGYQGLNIDNINLLIDNCNLDRIRLENEIGKIKSFFQDQKIDTDNLEKLLNTKINEDFNSLKNQALIGNKEKTNKLLSNTVLEPEKNIYYLNLINQRLSKIYEILNVKEKNKDTDLENIVNDIKPPIFWKDKPPLLAQLKKWSKDKVKYVLNKTYNAEIQIKSSSLIDKNIIMKKLIVDICKLANS